MLLLAPVNAIVITPLDNAGITTAFGVSTTGKVPAEANVPEAEYTKPVAASVAVNV